MAWFSKPAEAPVRVPAEEVWVVCSACKAYVPKDDWKAAFKVCPRCGRAERLTARERIDLLTDTGSFEEINADVITTDPLNFSDVGGAYADKVAATRAKLKMGESVVTGVAKIEQAPVVLAVMDFKFMGGSLGTATGEKIVRAAEKARELKVPLIIASASGGARMHEGTLSLMQMAKTCAAIQRLKDDGLLYISILTDPTTGGVSASYAMVGDFNIAEPYALIGFAGRRVIENTIKQKLPDEFQTAEYVLEHGFLDKIVPRSELKAFVAKLIAYAGGR